MTFAAAKTQPNASRNPAAPAPAPLNAGTQAVMNRLDYVFHQEGYRRPSQIEMGNTGAREVLPQFASRLGFQVATTPELMVRMDGFLRDSKTTLSELLEECDPSENYSGALGNMDAYQRQLALAGIRTKGVPEKGIYASKVGRFFQSEVPGSQILFPEFINRTMRESMIAPSILPNLVAVTTGVDSDVYDTIATNESVDDRRMKRVAQGTPFPKTTLATKEKAIRLYKYGREMEGSYEFFRNVSIDLFVILLRRIAMQNELDKATAAIDVIVNGDGNSNTAATVLNQSTLDTGAVPTFAGYIAYALNFWPYHLTTLVGNAPSLTKFMTMAYPNVNPLAVLDFLQGGEAGLKKVRMPQQFLGAIDLLYLPDLSGNILVGLDQSYTLEHVVRNGASMIETDKFISTQMNKIVISESDGFAKIFPEASFVWDWDS